MSRHFSLIAFEFPPFRGGIANYSQALASNLVSNEKQVEVYTLNPSALSGLYAIWKPGWDYQPHKWPFPIRKLLSFVYRQYQYKSYERLLRQSIENYKNKDSKIVITSLFFDFSRKLIDDLMDREVSYSLVLHGLDLYEIPKQYPDWFDRAIAESEQLIFNSKFTCDLFERRFLYQNSKVIVTPMIDVAKVNQTNLIDKSVLQDQMGIEKEGRWVISICRLIHRKGIDRSIYAMVEVMQKHDDVIYLIAGTGEQENELTMLVPEHLKKRIVFLGAISDKEKYSLLYYSDVFIMPNRDSGSDVEGFGISFIEASLMGNWVIGGNSGGVPEAIRTDLNGYLVDDHCSLEDLIEIVEKALHRSDTDLLKETKQWVIDSFDINRPSVL